MDKKQIVIITTGWFPEGDAGAVRLSMMGRILAECGFDVMVLCRGKLNDVGVYYGINYMSFRNMPGGFLSKAVDYELFPIKVIKYLNISANNIYAIYLYNAHLSLFKYSKKFCHRNGIKLFHDCVEWYSPEEFKRGEKSHDYQIKNKINTEIIDKQFSVISITKYLRNYFASKGIRTIRVPILCDCSIRAQAKAEQNEDKLVIFYGGLPGTKDLIGNLLEAVASLREEEKHKIKIILVGATKEYLVKVSHVAEATIDRCSGMLELCGRIPRSELLKKMEAADFSFLARDKSLRYAQAGFPSKVVEALSNATPMLCNISSDLEEYLIDGNNAIIAASHKPDDLLDAIRRAMSLSAAEKQKLSSEALQTAKRFFDYKNYIEELRRFLEG